MTAAPQAISGAYAGLRVLDLGQGIAAPYCAMLLAMHGAEIIKIEPPAGDWSRGLGVRYGDHTAMSAHYNRGKRSLALDLKAPAARDIAIELARRADIVVEGFRPRVAARLGLGYPALSALNPRLLYVSISGFGQNGPYVDRPCTDSVAQAFSGLAALNIGNDGAPHRVGAMIVDTVTGVYAAQAVGAALYARERRGHGQWLEVSLAQTAAAMLGHKLAEHVLEGGQPRAVNTPSGAYRTSDGWVMIALIRENDFPRLAGALDRPSLVDDPRFASFATRAEHAAPLFAILRATFAQQTTAIWLTRLHDADILADRINGFDDWLTDPHVVATGGAVAIRPSDMTAFSAPRTPGVPIATEITLSPAPALGEHGRDVLTELGHGAGEIDRLAGKGVIYLREPR
jgi:crotonobetainyl-CoA:carnitine CoA-transferase CaiB-like acyl-CoA transferase